MIAIAKQITAGCKNAVGNVPFPLGTPGTRRAPSSRLGTGDRAPAVMADLVSLETRRRGSPAGLINEHEQAT
jgi:hypothetical protein